MKRIGKTGAIPVIAFLLLISCTPTSEVADAQELPKNETTASQVVTVEKWQPWADIPLSNELQEYIHTLCEEHNLAYSFIIALIEVESNFNSDIVSTTNDYGLMQINACNHREDFDYLDPYDNVTMGIEMLSDLAEKYSDVESVLMAYNLGDAGAVNLWNQGIYSTEYTRNVLDRKLQYEKEHRGDL